MSGNGSDEHASIVRFDELVVTPFVTYKSRSQALGGAVAQQAEMVGELLQRHRRFLTLVPASGKPGPKVLPMLYDGVNEILASLQVCFCFFLDVS